MNTLSFGHDYIASRWKKIFLLILFSCSIYLYSDQTSDIEGNDALIDQYVQTLGNTPLVFSNSNIKQYWVDESVISDPSGIQVRLNQKDQQTYVSSPLFFRLKNVNESFDCKISIISKEKSYSFEVVNKKNNIISNDVMLSGFMDYSVFSTTIHMEDTLDFTFGLVFSSAQKSLLQIDRIVLSFSHNKNSSFRFSPDTLKLFPDNLKDMQGSINRTFSDGSFSACGTDFQLSSKNKLVISDLPVTNRITIKNTGAVSTHVCFGYAIYTLMKQRINSSTVNYSEKNKLLKVLSFKNNSNSLIVDSSNIEWKKWCILVKDCKEDYSDFPNFSVVGSITNVVKVDENTSKIILEYPYRGTIDVESQLRIQRLEDSYLYTHEKILIPGEEITFSHSMKKDDTFYSFSKEAFCKGTYYIVPVLRSYSVDSSSTNSITVKDFSISF